MGLGPLFSPLATFSALYWLPLRSFQLSIIFKILRSPTASPAPLRALV